MSARVFAVAMLACLPAQATAQEKTPGARPAGIDRATADAWAKRGFEAGWVRELGGRLAFSPEYPDDPRAMPALRFHADRDLADDDLKDPPAVGVPFALVLVHPRSKLTDAGVARLAGLANLRRLDVNSFGVTCEGLKPLADLKHLTTLKLGFTGASDGCVRHLAGFRNLTGLSLRNTKVGDDGLKALAGLGNLTALDLDGTKVTDDGLRHLAGLTNLTDLNLSSTGVTEAGMKHLAGLTNLRTLNLWLTEVDGENLKPFARMKKLTTLGIEGIKLTDESFRALSEMGLLHALTHADVYVYGPTDRSVEGGRRPTKPEDVRTFRLYARHATGEAVRYLAAFPNLEHLSLGTEQVTPAGLKYAAELKTVTDLTLESTRHAGDGLKHLADLKKLTHLHVGGTELPREDVKRLAAIKTLTHLHLPIGDETIRALYECGSLRLLWGATAADGKRAATDDEIVSLDLSRTRVKGEGLKYVAKLKNVATVDLRNTPVTTVWLEDFRRTRPKCVVIVK